MSNTVDDSMLLPCPFCLDRGRPRTITAQDEDGQFVAVICDMCGCSSRQHYFLGEDAAVHAVAAWNTRTPDPYIASMRETLEGIRDADWRRWEELSSPEEFVRWAKSRAHAALARVKGA